jgi:hypothetical protein
LVPDGVGAGAWNGQPATVNVSAIVTTGIPLTSTRVFDDTAVTGAAWVQVIPAVTWSTGPGITSPSAP